jgi:hypothetical protein
MRQVTISRNHSYDDGLCFGHYTLFVAGNDTATRFMMTLTYSYSLVQESSARRQQYWGGATHITRTLSFETPQKDDDGQIIHLPMTPVVGSRVGDECNDAVQNQQPHSSTK